MKWIKNIVPKINDYPIEHQYFSRGNMSIISKIIKKEQPDILFFQEIKNKDDAKFIQKTLGYKNFCIQQSWSHEHHITIISNKKITTIPRNHKDQTYSSYLIDNIEFIPVHLHYINSVTRKNQIEYLSSIQTTNHKIILGDFNIRKYRNHFMFNNDKKSYQLLKKIILTIVNQNDQQQQ